MAERKIFVDSVTPLPDEPGPTPQGLVVAAAEKDNREEHMTVLFSLDTAADKEAELEAKVARGEVIPPEELRTRYSANDADLDKLIKWLKSQKFEIADVSQDGTSVYARGSVGPNSEGP